MPATLPLAVKTDRMNQPGITSFFNNIPYRIFFSLIWLLTLPPLRILYFLADLVFLLLCYVFQYRRKIVLSNLRLVFPEKTESEIARIALDFYRHFSDHIIESFKLLHFTKADLNRHFYYENIDLLNNLLDEGKSIVLVSGHIGNWEWMVNIQSHLRHKYLAIYKPLMNKNFDRLVKHMREKFSVTGELVTMTNIYKRILQHEKEGIVTATWFLADQSPPADYPFRTEFFGVETPFYSGPAKLAKKFNYAVVYLEITKLRRGYYRAGFRLINDNPGLSKEDEIVKSYVEAIEESIKNQPETWLWSHRRWKHSK
jgi:Kdo2-lipid IVA lauroyltransferase/acyltransferase